MATNIHVTLNGEQRELPGGMSVDDLLENVGMKAGAGRGRDQSRARPEARFRGAALGEGDQVEIVEFVGGG